MSPNGSMNTVVPSALRRKLDWPYHSTCMLLLGSGKWGQRELAVPVAAAAQQRRGRGDEGGAEREREPGVKAVLERPGDQLWKEAVADERSMVGRREPVQHVR